MAVVAMVALVIISHIAPAAMVGFFSSDPSVVAVGEEYLRIASWSFVASGVIFVASSMFQAMGNTVPSLVVSAARITTFAIPAFFLARMSGFQLRWIWYLSVASVLLQLIFSMLLLRREYDRRLQFEPVAVVNAEPIAASPRV